MSQATQALPTNRSTISTALTGLRLIVLAGLLFLLGYLGLFALLESPVLWVHPTLMQEWLPGIFIPLLGIFPQDWTEAARTSGLGLLNALLYLALLVWLFGVYVFLLRRIFASPDFSESDSRRAFKIVIAVTAVIMLVLLFVRGMFSTDIYNYVWYGRIFTILGGNPFVDVAASYSAVDTGNWLQYGVYNDHPNAYGPVWVMLAGAVAWVGQVGDGNIIYHLLGHRLLADAAHLINIWLIWHVSGLVIGRYWRAQSKEGELASTGAWQRAARIAVTIAYAWNPLLLIEFGVSGHNDLLLVTCVLAALWLHLVGRWRLATLALATAGLVKFSAVIFLPGYIWLLFWTGAEGAVNQAAQLPQRLWRAGQAVLIVAAAYVVCFAPFWEGSTTLASFSYFSPLTASFNHSLGKILVFKVTDGIANLAGAMGWQPAQAWETDPLRATFDPYVRLILIAIAAMVAVLVTWHARTSNRLIPAWALVVFVYLTVGTFWFWPWYVSWVVVPVLLAGPGRLWNALVILCACSLTIYAIFPAGAEPLAPLVGWTGLINMGPPLAYLLLSRRPLFSYWSMESDLPQVESQLRADAGSF